MFVVHSYPLAVLFCVLTMFCWGSWANTRKLASKEWRFELFYWDYALGVLLLTLALGLTLGSSGTEGRSFVADLSQASSASIGSALLGGAIFNLANILLVAAIEIAGMAVAFPVGIGLALILGVIVGELAPHHWAQGLNIPAQMILRLGYAAGDVATPRRRIDDVWLAHR